VTTRRWLRIAAIALGAIVLLLATLYAAVVIVFPPARLAALLSEQVSAATGREFRIEGGLTFRILPTIAVRADDIVLDNVAGGSRPEMVRIRRAALEVSLRALLQRRIQILRVDVEGADVLLETYPAGGDNWHFTPRQAPNEAAAATGSDEPALAFNLERLVVVDAHIAYRDGAKPQPPALDIESLDLTAQDEGDRLAAVLVLAKQRWKLDGQVGRIDGLLSGKADWPVDLQLTGEGATLTATGSIGTGPRAGNLALELDGRLARATPLAPFAAGAAALPMPLELRASVRRAGPQLRLDALHLSLAGTVVDGRLAFVSGGPTPRIDGELSAHDIDFANLRPGAAAAKSSVATPATAPIFDNTPLPFDSLPGLDLRLGFKIERLKLAGLAPLLGVAGKLTTAPGRFTLDDVRAGLAGGTVRGRMSVARAEGAAPNVTLSIDAKSLSVPALESAAGRGEHFRGGRVNLAANLALAGVTPKTLAASATGDVLLTATDATLVGGAKALERNVIVTLLQLLIPTQSAAKPVVVECAVARLPLRRGVAVIDHSIALETREVAVSAVGQINLVDQTIRLEFRPRVKKGLGLNPASLAELMVMSGPLQDPQVGVDVKGAALGAADVGVAVATGGVSLLVSRALKSKDAPACGQAATEPVRAPAAKR
jgi:AsmA family protein